MRHAACLISASGSCSCLRVQVARTSADLEIASEYHGCSSAMSTTLNQLSMQLQASCSLRDTEKAQEPTTLRNDRTSYMATMDPNALQLASNWVQLLRHCLFCSSSSCIEQQCAAGRRFGHQLVANLAHQDINETHLDPLSRLFVHYVNCRVGAYSTAADAAKRSRGLLPTFHLGADDASLAVAPLLTSDVYVCADSLLERTT